MKRHQRSADGPTFTNVLATKAGGLAHLAPRIAQKRVELAIQDQSQSAVIAVRRHQDHGLREVGVCQRGMGDEQLPLK